ncbi:Hypothetical predicted protein [Mytilus galloprovincialis]|uniref:Uncharacterized protein n=1 Tax=Mytilus galloprovincialis TaxID=29158 RepID=A0A8B6BE65_MYTGA|nr:Hypothetical predicted protein [Mytilus galloprovincialis]
MFDLMNMITGYQTNYLEKLLGVVVSSQQFISEHITQYLTSFTEVTISTQQNIAEYTRNYFDVLSDTYIKPNDYPLDQAKIYYNSALNFNNQITNMMNHYIDDLDHPMLQQTTDITTYTYNNLVLPAVENTSNYRNVYRVEELCSRLKRNKEKRIPKTVSRIEKLYKLMDKSYDNKTRLLDELNYWSPVIMSQETKLRMANKAMEINDENSSVQEIRNLGSHVDLDLIQIKDKLDEMTVGVKREMSITASLYDE